MKTDVITVSSAGSGMDDALREAEKFAAYKELPRKPALHIRLLTEEAMGMMRAITGETEGEFWIEDGNGCAELHLRVHTVMDSLTRSRLLAASSSGKNEAARGIMGKLLSFFDTAADAPVFAAPFMPGTGAQMYGAMAWSMEDYRKQLRIYREQNGEGAEEAWDELEKSVVSNVADDVKVSVMGGDAELIILKKIV